MMKLYTDRPCAKMAVMLIILFSTFKLALQASFVVRYSFESLTQERD